MTQASVATDQFAKGDFRLGGVIGRSASVLSRHFPAYFIVSLAAYLPLPLLLLADPGWNDAYILLLMALIFDSDLPTGFLALAFAVAAWAVLGFVLMFVLAMLGQAIIAHAAFQDARRQPVRLVVSFKVGLRRFLPVIGLAFVMGLLLLPALILLIIPGLVLYTIWFVAVPACVVERLGPWRSLRRSQELTKGHHWKLFWLVCLLLIVSLGNWLVESRLADVAGPTAGLVGGVVWTTFWAAFFSVIAAVAYLDLRVAKEGVDIEQIAAVFD